MDSDKQIIRQELKTIRNALSQTTRASDSEKICKKILLHPRVVAANTVFVYLSFSSEVDTRSLIDELNSQSKKLAVPKILGKDKMIAVEFQDWNDLITAELGILTPKSAKTMDVHYDLVITPGLGFTKQGHRIGFGAGYYDRWFCSNSFAYSIALAFDEQIIETIPTDKFDYPVDEIITPNNHYITSSIT